MKLSARKTLRREQAGSVANHWLARLEIILSARTIKRQIRKTAIAVLENTLRDDETTVGDVIGAAAAELIEDAFDLAQTDGEEIFLVDSMDALMQVLECIAGHVKQGVSSTEEARTVKEDMMRVIGLMLENVIFGDPDAELEAAGIECKPDELDEDEEEADDPSDSELMSEIDADEAEAGNIAVLTPTPPKPKDQIN